MIHCKKTDCRFDQSRRFGEFRLRAGSTVRIKPGTKGARPGGLGRDSGFSAIADSVLRCVCNPVSHDSRKEPDPESGFFYFGGRFASFSSTARLISPTMSDLTSLETPRALLRDRFASISSTMRLISGVIEGSISLRTLSALSRPAPGPLAFLLASAFRRLLVFDFTMGASPGERFRGSWRTAVQPVRALCTFPDRRVSCRPRREDHLERLCVLCKEITHVRSRLFILCGPDPP